MKVPLGAAIEAAGARVVGTPPLGRPVAFSTDTRTLAPGEVFVALAGDRFDGHHYVRQALDRGAALVVVADSTAVPAGAPALVVDDTTRAYLAFAAAARARSGARVVAVTGSAGKTTTKTFLAQILQAAQSSPVVATPANENNAVGVAKLLLSIPEDAAFVVVELGARHYGEIEPLARAARPEVAVLTNVGDAHLEIFGSQDRLAETKWGIFATGARRVLSGNDPRSLHLALAAGDQVATTLFSLDERPATLPLARSVTLYGRERLVDDEGGGVEARSYSTDVRVPGDHNRRNAAAAAAAAFDLGLPGAAIAAAAHALALPAGRYERIALGDFAIVHDAYNASLAGTLATLASFAREPAGRRIAVLGSMAELGPDSPAMHAEVGAAAAAARLDRLLVGGPYAARMAAGARAAGYDGGRIVPFASNAEAAGWLRDNARAGDLILLKASRRYRLEDIVSELRSVHAG